MEANKILQADVLDIVFEGRNKEYGAYTLRKTYDRRLLTSLGVTAVAAALLFVGYAVAGNTKGTGRSMAPLVDLRLVEIPETTIEEPVKLPPPPKQEIQKIQTVQFTTPPRIVPDDDVKQEEMPPEVKDMEDAKISFANQNGIEDDGITAPPAADGKRGIIEAPKNPEEDEIAIFRKVEIESQYPGGANAWMRYLNKTFRYPDDAQQNGIVGTVEVQFIVDKEGNVSNVEAIAGPVAGGLREEAIRVIQKSGKWEPAIQNGRKVKSYKKQPITFRLDTE